jgi:hypothetical protein
MKTLMTTLAMTIAAMGSPTARAAEESPVLHRYLVERTFPPGALAGVDSAVKQKVNETNKTRNVTWVKSYMNHDQTKTYCVYKAPSEEAVREVARLNGLPVDNMTEIPDDIRAEPAGGDAAASGMHRYLVKRSGAMPAAGKEARFGAKLLTAYATAAKDGAKGSYSVYEAKSLVAVAQAAGAQSSRVESIVEIPQTLMPN